MPNSNEDVGYLVQLKGPDNEKIYPITSTNALFTTDGQKADNLLTYKVAGTTVTIPEIQDVVTNLQNQVNEAISNMQSQVENFISSTGLPISDVREYTVRTGETITAGTAVDVRPQNEGDDPTVFNSASPTAIALESGNAGDTIKVGFGGFAQCSGVEENDVIGTSGSNTVYARSPKDSWIWINPDHNYFTGEVFGATITVNTVAGATVTCAIDSIQQSQTATDGTATFTVTSIGEYTITSAFGSENKSTSTTITFDGEAKTISLYFALSDYSPAEIAAISEAGNAVEYFSLGDTIDIQLSGIGTMTLEIADFDHDYLAGNTSASKAGISFITKNLLYGNYQMNTGATNVGGFPDSKLYDTLSSTIWNAIPAEWRNVIKTVYKWYGTGDKTSNGKWFGSRIWVPLEYEMFGATTYSPATEHSTGKARKYPIFTDDASRIKKMNNGTGNRKAYWLASPRPNNTSGFCRIETQGQTAANATANGGYGVCFGLCI